jgi:stress response protein YsnF
MARTIVAMFDSRADAERAAEFLIEEGFERRHLDIRSEPWTEAGTARAEERDQSWWEWLFGESDERTSYNEGLQQGGALLAVTAPDDRVEDARNLLEARGVEVEEATAAESTAAAATPETTGEREVIPVVEEHVKIGKRPVARGGVRVYSRVIEQPVEQEIDLREERVRVERRPVDRPVSAADEAFRDRRIEVTESGEEPVVAKEARVVEEIGIEKDVTERAETIREAVRRTDVDVQKIPPASGGRFAEQEDDFRSYWRTNLEERGVAYESSRLAYEYGAGIAADPRYTGRDWASIEPELQSDWDREHGGTWEKFKDSIRYAWDRARGHRRAA